MFETLMQSGSHRVDYLNESAVGTSAAFAFYVCGGMSSQVPYSLTARRRLLAGLKVIHEQLGPQNLVGIYLDVHAIDQRSSPAFGQMCHDLRVGKFKRIFIYEVCNELAWQKISEEFSQLSFEIGQVEMITYRDGVYNKLVFNGTQSV